MRLGCFNSFNVCNQHNTHRNNFFVIKPLLQILSRFIIIKEWYLKIYFFYKTLKHASTINYSSKETQLLWIYPPNFIFNLLFARSSRFFFSVLTRIGWWVLINVMFNIDSLISISKIPSIALDVIIIIIITIGLSGDGGGGSQPHTKRVAKCISGRLTFAVRVFFLFNLNFIFTSTARAQRARTKTCARFWRWFGLAWGWKQFPFAIECNCQLFSIRGPRGSNVLLWKFSVN